MSTYDLDNDERFSSNMTNDEYDSAKAWFISEWVYLPSMQQDILYATFCNERYLKKLIDKIISKPSQYLVELRVNSLCLRLIRCPQNSSVLTSILV